MAAHRLSSCVYARLPILSVPGAIVKYFPGVCHELVSNDLPTIAKLAKETLIFVLLGLPFFLPLIFSAQLGLGFWVSIGLESHSPHSRLALGSSSFLVLDAYYVTPRT
jgi:hypothetical protein